ncbi:hypothetical protein LTR36_001638 [Oleoguttula mirabilis]|uniref:NmrA-like domain-containing protein n=1 Tax=Oleoguttula mirabilis TaxID=1507867 RepID=A0AAV9JPI8_9PEZI|nr:hypothetical protein LTR36_001638 [Oleoguttula mirabilis]
MSETLVITCPGGKQCAHLIPLLYNKGKFKLRLAAHSEASVGKLQSQFPDAEVVHTDIADYNHCRQLLKGATAAIIVLPSLHSREKEMGLNLVDAAVAETQRPGNVFEHFVFSSVLGTQHRNLMQHDLKSYIEERLYLSQMDWTILKPTNFMDAYPVAMLASQDKPVMEKLWAPEIGNSLIALRDLAEAIAKVLNEREVHYLAEYSLCSTMPISDAEMCKEIGKQIGKEIEVRAPTFETGVNKLLNYMYGGKADQIYAGASSDFNLAAEGDIRGDIVRDEAERLILFYNRRGLRGSPNVLRWLLGREPMTIADWVANQLEGVGPRSDSSASIKT